jgi:signal transduction histidine kinase
MRLAESLTFRAKLTLIVAVMAVGFLLDIVMGSLSSRRVEQQLTTIRERYMPMVALEPTLEAQFDKIRRNFQDAVASKDTEALGATASLEAELFERLETAHGGVDPEVTARLRVALDDYIWAADEVSRRLIANETGESISDAIVAMQAKHATFLTALKTTSFDERRLDAAFVEAVSAEASAYRARLAITIVCLIAATIGSIWMSRDVLRSVAAVTAGMHRFGAGDFAQPIPVTSGDEIGRLAEEANQMAANLQRLEGERAKSQAALELSNRELEAFSYSVAHDLRAPLRSISGFSTALLEDCGESVSEQARGYLNRITSGSARMAELIDALLMLSRVSRSDLRREPVNMTHMAEAVIGQLRASQPDRAVRFAAQADVTAEGDPVLLRTLLENLLGNAWKFTSARASATIEFGAEEREGERFYFVRDDGAGFDMAYADRLFAPFQRLHPSHEFGGTGIGLATVQRIVHRHGGRIRAEGAVDRGATFRFTLRSERRGSFA